MKRFAVAPLFCLLTFSVDASASMHAQATLLGDEDAVSLRVDAVYKTNRMTQFDDSITWAMAELASNKTVQKLKSRSIDTQHALNILTFGIVYIKDEYDIKPGYYMIDDADRKNSKVHDAFFNKFTDIFVTQSDPLAKEKPSKKRERPTDYSKEDLSVYPFSVSGDPDKVNLATWRVSEGPKLDDLTKITLKHVAMPSIFNYREIIATFFSQFGVSAQEQVTPYGSNATVSFEMNEPISNRTATVKVTTTFGTMKPQHLANKEIPWYLLMTSQIGNKNCKFTIHLNHPQLTQSVPLGFLDMTFND